MSVFANLFPQANSAEDVLNNDTNAITATPEMLDAALAEEEGREYVPVVVKENIERAEQPTLSVGPQTPKETDEKSFGGAMTAMAATAAQEALPTAAAMAAFPVGGAVGGAVGIPTGPAAIATGIVGGLATSAAAYWAVSEAQEAALEFVAPESYAQFQGYLEKAKEDYPVSTFIGRTAVPMRSMMKFDAGNVTSALSFSRELLKGTADLNSTVGKLKLENFMNVAFGAGSEMAAEAMRQWQEDGRLDFALLGAATLVGAGMNKPTALGSKVLGISPFKVKDQLPSEPVTNQTDEELAQALMEELDAQPKPKAEGEPPKIVFDPKDGIGQVPFNMEIDTRGFVVPMTPDQFLSIAAPRRSSASAPAIEKRIRAGESVGNPFLDVKWDEKNKRWKTVGHEGRNRSEAIKNIDPATQMPVHIFPKGMRASDITEEMRNAPIVAESGTDLFQQQGSSQPEIKPLTPAQQKQTEEDALQLDEFSKLITGKMLDDVKKQADAGSVLNTEVLNSAITREPEKAITALGLALKKQLQEAKGDKLTFERRLEEAKKWMKSHGYQDRIQMLKKTAASVEDANYQILAARFMSEQAMKKLEAAELKWRNSKSEADLAEAIVAMQDVKKVLFPLEQARTNWGRLGHAFRKLPPELRNMSTIQAMMKKAGIDEMSGLNTQRAEQVMEMLSMALRSDNPKALKRALNMTTQDKIMGALGEMLTSAVMSPIHTPIISTIGGAGETLIAPINGTLGSLARMASEVIKLPIGKGNTQAMKQRAYEIQGFMNYYAYVMMRAKANWSAAWNVVKTSEPSFGSKSTQLVEVRGGMPVDRSQRVAPETRGIGASIARRVYGAAGPYRSQGFLSSETFGIDPNKNPFGALAVDVLGETFRSVHRGILGADEFIKASNAFAAARSKFLVEGKMKGLRGEQLQKYIDENSDLLMDANNKLYTRERITNEVLEELKKEGLEGSEAYAEMLRRVEARYREDLGAAGEEAEEWARQITYQSDLGDYVGGGASMGKRFQQTLTGIPALRLAFGFYFIQSPVNLVKMTGRYLPTTLLTEAIGNIPLNGKLMSERFPMLKNVQREFTEAMASNNEFRKNQAVGRQVMGMFLTQGALMMAANSVITGGGPSGKEQRKLWLAENLPYSFRIPKNSAIGQTIQEGLQKMGIKADKETAGNYFFEYKRIFEPVASFMMAASDVTEYMKRPEMEDKGVADMVVTLSIVGAKQMTEKVYFNNIKQFIDLANGVMEDKKDWGQKLLTYLGRRVAPLTFPVFESRDPLQYELYSFTQHIARRQPEGVRNAIFGEDYFLPRAYNVIGENIDAPISDIPLVDFFNPLYVSSKPADPVVSELIRLNHDFSSPEKYQANVEGKMYDMRNIPFKGDNDVKSLAKSANEPTVFDFKAAQENLKDQKINKRTANLAKTYTLLGVSNLPEANQDSYDRWQQNIGQIKINGKTLRQSLEQLFEMPEYKNLETTIFRGEENPRAAKVTKVISAYRSTALDLTRMEYPTLDMFMANKKAANQVLKMGGKREDISKVKEEIDKLITFPNQK